MRCCDTLASAQPLSFPWSSRLRRHRISVDDYVEFRRRRGELRTHPSRRSLSRLLATAQELGHAIEASEPALLVPIARGGIEDPFVNDNDLSIATLRHKFHGDPLNRPEEDGLTHACAAIHQEMTFKAPQAKVFDALINADEFDAITRLSDAVTLVTATNAKPTSISRDVGGTFTLFGGYVTGRNVEIVPYEKLVQVWRAGSWPAGDYSIAKFVLIANGPETRLVFDHRGFPDGEGTHLAAGWRRHYWEPLARYLAPRP
jgi:activator of HSP90 ATPase